MFNAVQIHVSEALNKPTSRVRGILWPVQTYLCSVHEIPRVLQIGPYIPSLRLFELAVSCVKHWKPI